MAAQHTLDTSGEIITARPLTDSHDLVWRWSDLTPFAQGYVEALFAVFEAENPPRFERHRLRFSDLSPEALGMILGDCERLALHPETQATHANGRNFWFIRQKGTWLADHPPLTVSLGDDGKIYLRPTEPAAQP